MKQVAYGGRLARGRNRLWPEVARVLGPDGAAVLLGASGADDEAMLSGGLRRSVVARVSLFGTWTEISVAHPT